MAFASIRTWPPLDSTAARNCPDQPMAVITPPLLDATLNQGETLDDLPLVAENLIVCPVGTGWSNGIQSSTVPREPFNRWRTTLAAAPRETLASTAFTCSMPECKGCDLVS